MKGWIVIVGALALAVGTAQAQPLGSPAPTSAKASSSAGVSASVTLTRVGSPLRDEQKVGTYWWGTVCIQPTPLLWKDLAKMMTGLDAVFAEEFAAAGLKAGSDPSNLFAEAAPTSGDLQVGALVKSADASYCENVIKTSGKVTLGVEWQIYSGLRREVVARIETTGTYEAKKLDDRSKRSLAQEAFAANVRSLLADERFRQVMTDDPAQAIGSPATRFEAIQIVGPKAASVPLSAAVQSVAAVFAGGGHGSGFVVSSDGYLLTNQHVVGDAKYVKVRWADGFEALGEVVRSDRRRDVALIKTSAKVTPLALRSSPAALGETVFAIGTPLDAKFQNTVTKGVVSASRTYDGLAFLQSDVGINPGNSGGPLLDEKGSVLGISVSTYQVNDAPTGLNLFVPIAEALDTLALRPAN